MWILLQFFLNTLFSKMKTCFNTLSSVVKHSHYFTEQTKGKERTWPGFPLHVLTEYITETQQIHLTRFKYCLRFNMKSKWYCTSKLIRLIHKSPVLKQSKFKHSLKKFSFLQCMIQSWKAAGHPSTNASTTSSPLSITSVFTHSNDKCQVGGDLEPYLCALWLFLIWQP